MTTTTNPGATNRGMSRAWVNTLIVAGGYLLSRVLGLVREIIIARQFGTGADIAAYKAAFTVLDLIYIIIAGGALGSSFIPVFAKFLEKEQREEAWRLASAVLNIAFVALIAACVLIALFAAPLVRLTVASGFDPAGQALTAHVLRLLLIQPVLLGIGGLAKATLETFDRFTLPAIGSNLYNLGIIGGALLAGTFKIDALIWGVNIGAALFLLVQLPGLRGVGVQYLPTFRFSTPGVRQIGRLLGPRLFGQSVWQINLIVVTSVASMLGTAAVAANNLAFQLMLLPHGLIALSLGTVIFPQLARLHAAGDVDGVRATALGAVRSVLFLALPAAAVLAVLRLPVLRLLYQRSAFDAASTALTADALLFYAVGLAAFAAAEIVVRTFYAMQDTRTPVVVGLAAVLLNVVLALTLPRTGLGLGGLTLGFSIANMFEWLTLMLLLGRQMGGIGVAFWGVLGRMVVATLGFGAVLLGLRAVSASALPALLPGDTYRWPGDFLPLALWLVVALALGGAAYAGIAALLGLSELHTVFGRFTQRLRRTRGNT